MRKGLGSPRDNIRHPAVRAVTTSPRQALLDRLLQQFERVFDALQGLPPARPYDHRIHLLLGTALVAVCPYRFPQLQKNMLERQCVEMLAQGTIVGPWDPCTGKLLAYQHTHTLIMVVGRRRG